MAASIPRLYIKKQIWFHVQQKVKHAPTSHKVRITFFLARTILSLFFSSSEPAGATRLRRAKAMPAIEEYQQAKGEKEQQNYGKNTYSSLGGNIWVLAINRTTSIIQNGGGGNHVRHVVYWTNQPRQDNGCLHLIGCELCLVPDWVDHGKVAFQCQGHKVISARKRGNKIIVKRP